MTDEPQPEEQATDTPQNPWANKIPRTAAEWIDHDLRQAQRNYEWTSDTAHQHRPETPLDGPLHLTVAFYMPRPKARTKAVWADRKPDLSKLLRATEDALTDSGMISDDSRIVDCTITKRYSRGDDPWTGADITVATLEDGS